MFITLDDKKNTNSQMHKQKATALVMRRFSSTLSYNFVNHPIVSKHWINVTITTIMKNQKPICIIRQFISMRSRLKEQP